MLQPDELIAAVAASVPRFTAQMVKASGVEMNGSVKVRTPDSPQAAVKLLGFIENCGEFRFGEIE